MYVCMYICSVEGERVRTLWRFTLSTSSSTHRYRYRYIVFYHSLYIYKNVVHI